VSNGLMPILVQCEAVVRRQFLRTESHESLQLVRTCGDAVVRMQKNLHRTFALRTVPKASEHHVAKVACGRFVSLAHILSLDVNSVGISVCPMSVEMSTTVIGMLMMDLNASLLCTALS